MNPLLIEQLARHAAQHRDARNLAAHRAGVPLTVFALLVLLSRPLMPLTPSLVVSPAVAVALGVLGGFYWTLDRRFAIVLAGFFGVCVALGNWLATQDTALWLGVGAGLFALGWLIQFAGHAFEGKQPALWDNLIGLLSGPLFVVAEISFALGWRLDLQAAIEARAGPIKRCDAAGPAQ